jgi:hypothetical protein
MQHNKKDVECGRFVQVIKNEQFKKKQTQGVRERLQMWLHESYWNERKENEEKRDWENWQSYLKCARYT